MQEGGKPQGKLWEPFQRGKPGDAEESEKGVGGTPEKGLKTIEQGDQAIYRGPKGLNKMRGQCMWQYTRYN